MLDRRLKHDLLALMLCISASILIIGFLLTWLASPITDLERCAVAVHRLSMPKKVRALNWPPTRAVSYRDGERWCSIVGPREGYRRALELHNE
jgi:hypothetical protein